MSEWTPQDLAAWLRHIHGGDWPPAMIDVAAALADGLNALVRDAAADLPLEREPIDFQHLVSTIAGPEHGDV